MRQLQQKNTTNTTALDVEQLKTPPPPPKPLNQPQELPVDVQPQVQFSPQQLPTSPPPPPPHQPQPQPQPQTSTTTEVVRSQEAVDVGIESATVLMQRLLQTNTDPSSSPLTPPVSAIAPLVASTSVSGASAHAWEHQALLTAIHRQPLPQEPPHTPPLVPPLAPPLPVPQQQPPNHVAMNDESHNDADLPLQRLWEGEQEIQEQLLREQELLPQSSHSSTDDNQRFELHELTTTTTASSPTNTATVKPTTFETPTTKLSQGTTGRVMREDGDVELSPPPKPTLGFEVPPQSSLPRAPRASPSRLYDLDGDKEMDMDGTVGEDVDVQKTRVCRSDRLVTLDLVAGYNAGPAALLYAGKLLVHSVDHLLVLTDLRNHNNTATPGANSGSGNAHGAEEDAQAPSVVQHLSFSQSFAAFSSSQQQQQNAHNSAFGLWKVFASQQQQQGFRSSTASASGSATGRPQALLKGHNQRITRIDVSCRDRWMLTTSGTSLPTEVTDATTGSSTAAGGNTSSATNNLNGAHTTPNSAANTGNTTGNANASHNPAHNGLMILWDLQMGSRVATLQHVYYAGKVAAIAFNTQETLLATAGFDDKGRVLVIVWDILKLVQCGGYQGPSPTSNQGLRTTSGSGLRTQGGFRMGLSPPGSSGVSVGSSTAASSRGRTGIGCDDV